MPVPQQFMPPPATGPVEQSFFEVPGCFVVLADSDVPGMRVTRTPFGYAFELPMFGFGEPTVRMAQDYTGVDIRLEPELIPGALLSYPPREPATISIRSQAGRIQLGGLIANPMRPTSALLFTCWLHLNQ
mmetsp:Transcript_11700/g.47252  ORF Transcript_11700/g.47252 Transcript_11700/m.47252 type:complete len:130 (-) Transcript_11700:37-426(-)